MKEACFEIMTGSGIQCSCYNAVKCKRQLSYESAMDGYADNVKYISNFFFSFLAFSGNSNGRGMKKVRNHDCFICMENGIKYGGVELGCCKKSCCNSCLNQWKSSSCPHCRAILGPF
jgi:hypothetical protein